MLASFTGRFYGSSLAWNISIRTQTSKVPSVTKRRADPLDPLDRGVPGIKEAAAFAAAS